MRLKLKERVEELEPNLKRWAACCAGSSAHMSYPPRWYKTSDLNKCYCSGKDDTFPCPHCQNLQDWQNRYGHPALVSELTQWWKTLILMIDAIKQGGLVDAASHINARDRAAYAIYALTNHQVMVEVCGNSCLVKDKPGRADSRNFDLIAWLNPPAPQAATTTPPVGWRFVPPQGVTLPSPDRWAGLPWTDEQRAASARYDRPPAPALYDRPPAPAFPPQTYGQKVDLMKLYADHLKKVVGLVASGVNVDGDMILVAPESVAEFVALPCKAEYSVHEQTLVVKIAARDLLDRYCGGGGGDGSTSPAEPDAPAPITDWLGAALGDPSQSRGMCAPFGYSHEPELQRRRGVGLRRR